MSINQLNQNLKKNTPEEIVAFFARQFKKPIVSTNFRPYESAILHLVNSVIPNIPVLWVDTGYNTAATYRHAEELTKQLSLNIQYYAPLKTTAYIEHLIPERELGTPELEEFTQFLKLEPFTRAMKELKPDVWFTNLRKGQTAHRDELDVVSEGMGGSYKVAPFYRYDDRALDSYLDANQLPNEFDYIDPTKVEGKRECGLHTKV